MHRIRLLCCSFLAWLLWTSTAGAQVQLDTIRRTDERERLQLHCTFSRLPEHDLQRDGRRLDLTFKDTVAGPELRLPEADEHIIKSLARPEGKQFVLTLFFRYPPQQVTLTPQEQSSRLMLDVQLGNQYSQAFPDLTSQLQGLSFVPQDGKDSTSPANLSRFQGDWRLLFERLELPLTLHPPPGYTLPPFPMMAFDRSGQNGPALLLPAPIMDAAAKEDWDSVLASLRDSLATRDLNAPPRAALLISYGEALLRANKHQELGQFLDQLRQQETPGAQVLWQAFLLAQLQARQGDPHLARITLDALDTPTINEHPLASHINLFLAELSLATGQLDQAEAALNRDDVAYTGQAIQIRRLRRADISYLRGEQIKAFAGYLRLGQQGDLLLRYPLSLAGYADALYHQHQYPEAAKTYQDLASLLVEEPSRWLALYRQAMSELHRGEQRNARRILEQVMDGGGESEAVSRARLKTVDLDYLTAARELAVLAERYNELFNTAATTVLREEALLKHAVVVHQMGARDKAVELAMRLLREFQHGKLRIEAQALLLQDLPEVLRGKIHAEEYVEALVLARQNRDLFARRWIDLSVLDANADAYLKLGFPDRAIKVLQYLMEASPPQQQEKQYRKLIETLIQAERYDMAEDYADRHLLRYPNGEQVPEIFLLRLQALRQAGRARQAADLLAGTGRPRNREIDLLGADILFQLERFQETAELLSSIQLGKDDTGQQARFQLAESLYQAQHPQEAQEHYRMLLENVKYGDLAHYRLGQIQQHLGLKDEAVNLWSTLADKGKDPRWQKLAGEELKSIGKKIR